MKLNRRLTRLRTAMKSDSNLHMLATFKGKPTAFVSHAPQAIRKYGGADEIDYVEIPPITVIPPEGGLPEAFPFGQVPGNLYKYRPVEVGVSCANVLMTAGTVGGMVRDKSTGKFLLLSNYHVLAMDEDGREVSLGTDIWQPGPYDLGTPEDHVADLLRWYRPKQSITTNKIDAAVATLVPQPITGNGPTEIMNMQVLHHGYIPTQIGEAYVYQQVRKTGRTTGYDKRAYVGAIDAVGSVSYPPERNPTIVQFEDLIITDNNDYNRNFSRPGDSGSAVLDWSNNRLIGLLFAGSANITIICKIKHVFDYLNIELLEPPELTRTEWLDLSHWQGDIPRVMSVSGENEYEAYNQDTLEALYAGGAEKANISGLEPYSFQSMKDKGIEGVILKVSQGIIGRDDKFPTYYEYARAAGLRVAGYHFNDPQYPSQDQMNNFVAAVGNRVLEFPALDCEIHSNKDNGTVTAVTEQMLSKMETWASKPAVVYTSVGFWNTHVNRSSRWSHYPLWIAFWSKTAMSPLLPHDWTDHYIWQHEVSEAGEWFGVSSAKVDNNTTKYVNFKNLLSGGTPPPPGTFALHITVVGQGSVAVSPENYQNGDVVALTATAAAGWSFTGWSGDLTGTANPASLTMDSDKNVTATFTQLPPAGRTEFTTYRAKVINSSGLNCRKAPNTSAGVWLVVPVGELVDVLEVINNGPEDIWVRVGKNQYCAFRYAGRTYLEYI